MAYRLKTAHLDKETAMDIILASSSPRRRELLASAQLDFSSISVDVDETRYDNESPQTILSAWSLLKLKAAIQQLNDALQIDAKFTEPLIILTLRHHRGASRWHDSAGKTNDREHAYGMWQQMSDTIHEVWTAVQATHVSLLLNGLIPQTINQRYKWSNSKNH